MSLATTQLDVASCHSPPLDERVIYRDKRGDLWLGGNGMFMFNGESFDRIH